MLNEVFKEGVGISLPAPALTLSGTALRVGILNAVAIVDEATVTDPNNVVNGVARSTAGVGNAPGWVSSRLEGAYRIDVTGVTVHGGPVYIKTDGTLTTTATGAFLYGAALEVKSAPKAKCIVKLLQPGQIAASA